MRSLKGCSDFTSRWWMPLPSISPLFMLLFCSCVLCPTEQFSSSYLVKEEFSVKFSPFLAPDYCLTNSTSIVPEPCLSVPVLCSYFLSSKSQQRFRFSKHERIKQPSVHPGVFFGGAVGGERIRIKEPSVEVVSETSKNRQFSWKNRQRTCD